MDKLPVPVLDIVGRLARTAPSGSNPDRAGVEGALTKMFDVAALPRRTFLWLEGASDAYLYLARRVQDSLKRLAGDTVALEAVPEQELFHAAESAFDSAWVLAWPDLLADCQIAAGKTGDVERMQAAYRQLQPFATSPEAMAVENACAQAESELASQLPGTPEDSDNTLADLMLGRIVRHQNNLSQLVHDFVPTLVADGAPASAAAHIIAHEAVAAWECGGRVFWVRPDEIVLASKAR